MPYAGGNRDFHPVIQQSLTTETMTRGSRALVPAALLMIGGLPANGAPALAQASEACPWSPATYSSGLEATEPPAVTAQQVVNGTRTLRQFTLAVRQQATIADIFHFGCVIRQEGSPWRSGSTYIVVLTFDGTVLGHAKDMSLSGRQLKPSIYREILAALEVGSGDMANLPAALTAAASRNGGSFAVPGSSSDAYAAAWRSNAFTVPNVLVAGFDLDESHLVSLADEDIYYGSPSTTAADVVDRATLQAFVTEAENHFRSQLEISQTAASKAKVAFRDPNGPWRHGSVYLHIWDLDSRTIFFHGGFPNKYELQALIPRHRDAKTGEYILPKLIAAAESGPEGGFVEYHFDDPNDAFDRADIPKTGYVRRLAGRLPFVVGSGFYKRPSPQVSQNTVMEAVLPQIMRSVTASTVDAVSSRIERATSATAPATAFSLGGTATLSDALQANGQALANGGIDLDRLLANSSFTLPLTVADNGDGGEGSPFGSFTFWGSGDYRSISGGSPQSVDYDGSVTSANLGIDTRLGADVLAGLAMSWSRGTVDYKASDVSGDLTTRLLSVNPYLGWQMPSGMNLWSMAGYGFGKVEIDDKAAAAQESDLNQRMFAAGLKGTLASSDQLIAGGTTNLNVKGEVAFTWADVEGAGSIDDMALQVGRQRLMLEGAHVRKLDSGATFTSSLELGVRNDTGDGETGTGAEVGGALRYQDAASRLTVEGRVRTLVSHSGDTGETGVSGLLRIAPNASGHGLALTVEPSWGRTASSVQQLWESGIGAGTPGGNQARLNAEVGYGFDAPQGLGGVVAPYTGLGLTGNGSQSWRMGARWQMAGDRSVSLEGARHEAANHDGSEHSLMLRGTLLW